MADGGRFRLVIVGGGVAGLELATRLGRRIGRRGRAEVTLVDRGLAHVWKPMLHEIAAGTAVPDREKIGYLAQAARENFRFHPGSLRGVDRARRVVLLDGFDDGSGATIPAAGHEVGYDALVLAVGSRANDFGTQGVAEHALFLDSLSEAETFFTRFRRSLIEAMEAGRPFGVAIVGGGATGVELAAELHQALDAAGRYAAGTSRGADGGRPADDLRVTLIEAGPRLLPNFPDHVSRAAEATLRSLGVTVLTGAAVDAVSPDGARLKDGRQIPAGLTVWAAGVRAPDAIGTIDGLERDKAGRLLVRPTLQTTTDDRVLAMGDCAALRQPDGHPVPATAQAARQEAIHLGRVLPGWIAGGALTPFRYRDRGALVSLGDYNGWGTMGRFTFGGGLLKGLSARAAHAMLYRQHQFELRGAGPATATWLAAGLSRIASPRVRLD